MMKRSRKKRHINWFVIIMGGIIIYFASIIISQQVYLSQVAEDKAAAEIRLENAKKENAALRQEKQELSDLSSIERIAREDLGMTKAGELPYSSGHK